MDVLSWIKGKQRIRWEFYGDEKSDKWGTFLTCHTIFAGQQKLHCPLEAVGQTFQTLAIQSCGETHIEHLLYSWSFLWIKNPLVPKTYFLS